MKYIKSIAGALAELLSTRLLASCSIFAFIFIVLRLCFPMEPLLLFILLIGILLILMNYKKKINAFTVVLLCISMFLGMWRACDKIYDVQLISEKIDNHVVRLEGSVASVVSEGQDRVSFYMEADKLFSHVGEFEGLKVYVHLPKGYDLNYGDRIIINAHLMAVENADTWFSRIYLAKGAAFTAYDAVLLERRAANITDNPISVMRNYIFSVAERFFRGDVRELFKALTAGDQSGFSVKLKADLAGSGLSHVASVSGLHVSILGMAIYRLFARKNEYAAAAFSIMFVFLFTFLTGAMPAATRSAMMFSLFMISKILFSDNDSITALGISAVVLAMINPYVVFDWGFILSFLSVLGILLLYPQLKKELSFLPNVISESFAVTLSSQIMTLPAIAGMFGTFSVYSMLSNVVVSAIFLWVLYLCFIMVLVSAVPLVNYAVSILCAFSLDAVICVAKLFSDLPYAVLNIESFDFLQYVVYYTIVLMFILKEKISARKLVYVMLLCIFTFALRY